MFWMSCFQTAYLQVLALSMEDVAAAVPQRTDTESETDPAEGQCLTARQYGYGAGAKTDEVSGRTGGAANANNQVELGGGHWRFSLRRTGLAGRRAQKGLERMRMSQRRDTEGARQRMDEMQASHTYVCCTFSAQKP